jgi:hypothetical protein
MSWTDAYKHLRNGGAKPVGADVPGAAAPPSDRNLPLGARIGSLVWLQQSPLLGALADGSLIALPDSGDNRIVAVSQVRLKQAGGLYRYYLDTGDADGKEKFLQVYQNAEGQVAEVMYCTQLTRVIPETVEDQEAYMGLANAGLGERSYILWRAQLDDVGLDETDLDLVFGNGDGIDYWRDAGDDDEDFITPFSGTEIRIDNPSGSLGMRQELYFMPYVRELRSGGSEYLLITTEIVSRVNGDASKRGIHVDFVIGIPIQQESIVIRERRR